MKERFQELLREMNRGIYEKETEIALSLLAAMAGESIILLGPPGVAKSMVARQLKKAFEGARSFEYLMSRFSTPDEIFGPVSIQKLKTSDTYERATDGYLPSADVVFLDEIWKAGPAIQNTLLTVINEKLFRNGNHETPIPLKLLVAASNELPAKGEGLEALWDRFLIRLECSPIRQEKNFLRMLASPPTPLQGEGSKMLPDTNADGQQAQADEAYLGEAPRFALKQQTQADEAYLGGEAPRFALKQETQEYEAYLGGDVSPRRADQQTQASSANHSPLLGEGRGVRLSISQSDYAHYTAAIYNIGIAREVFDAILLIRKSLRSVNVDEAAERRDIYISDRRWKKIAQLLRASAFMQDRSEARLADLLPIYHCLWQEPEERGPVRAIVIRALFAPMAHQLVDMKKALADDIKYHRMKHSPTDGRDYEGEIEQLSDRLTTLEREISQSLFVSSDDKAQVAAYLRDFYKELAFTRQDAGKLYE